MRTEEERSEAIKVLSEYLKVTIESFNQTHKNIFQVRGNELEIMIEVIKNDRSPVWVYQNTIGNYNEETFESDNIQYYSGKKALDWMMKMNNIKLEDLV